MTTILHTVPVSNGTITYHLTEDITHSPIFTPFVQECLSSVSQHLADMRDKVWAIEDRTQRVHATIYEIVKLFAAYFRKEVYGVVGHGHILTLFTPSLVDISFRH